MYLLDTNVVSEIRKGRSANPGVQQFFSVLSGPNDLYLPVQTVGEIRGGIEAMRRRKDLIGAQKLDAWLNSLLQQYANHILDFTVDCAQVWGTFLLPKDPLAVDKQLAAMGLVYNLKIVTRNLRHFAGTGASVINPFT